MFVYSITVWVVPDQVDAFIQATRTNAQKTRTETGNLRFEFSQSIEDPAQFLLYEVYRDEEAVKAHQQTDHYLQWRETVAPWMARKRQGVRHHSLFPETEEAWIAGT